MENRNAPTKAQVEYWAADPETKIEREMLGLVITDAYSDETEYETAMSELEKEDFFGPLNRMIYEGMSAVHEKGEKPTSIAIRRYSPDIPVGEIENIIAEKSFGSVYETLLKAIRENRKRRTLAMNLRTVLAHIDNGDSDYEYLTEKALETAKKIDDGRKQFFDSMDYIYDVYSRFGKPKDRIRTGYLEVDKKLGGGLVKGSLNVIAGRPSDGKSTLVMNIVTNALLAKNAEGKSEQNVLYFTLEDSKADVITRMAAHLSRRSQSDVANDKPGAYNDLVTAYETHVQFADRLCIVDEHNVSANRVKATCIEFKAHEKRLDLVVIDYLTMMDMGPNAVKNINGAIAEVTRKLKGLALELDTTILLLSQMNRAVEKEATRDRGEAEKKPRKPMLSDLRDSGSIEQDADVVMFIQRPTEDGEFSTLFIRKNRNGAVGEVNLAWQPDIYTFDTAYEQDIPKQWREDHDED